MANIRVDVDYTIKDGTELVFRSPCDCTEITGLIVYYATEDGPASMEFALADAHGENVGDIPHLFVDNVVVKVILDVASGMAFVQNADTNAYLEAQLAGKAPIDHTHIPADVGAAPASHVTNKSNPHGVTAAQVGAAPAGYGLGLLGAVYTSDINTCTHNGWYYTNEATRNVPHVYFQEASVLVMGRTSTYIVQKLTSIYYRSIMMRYTTDGGATWVEEWVEPPMAVGVEYRTAERFEGKPVYAKLIDFGALPNATYKTVSLGTTNGRKIVCCHAVTSTGVALPYVDTSSTAAGWMMRVKNASASAVTIETTGNYSTLTVCVFVKYTKATD